MFCKSGKCFYIGETQYDPGPICRKRMLFLRLFTDISTTCTYYRLVNHLQKSSPLPSLTTTTTTTTIKFIVGSNLTHQVAPHLMFFSFLSRQIVLCTAQAAQLIAFGAI